MGLMAPSATLKRACAALLHHLLPRHEFWVAAEQNVGAAAGHVGGDGDHAEAARLRNDFGFALVVLGVEHDVANAFALQNGGEALGLLNGVRCPPAPAVASHAGCQCRRQQL